MALAKLYDTTAGAVTVRTMLKAAEKQPSFFQCGDAAEVSDGIEHAKRKINALEPILRSIRDRRNKWLAHLDPNTVLNPKALAKKAKLTIPDLDQAYGETEELLVKLCRLHDGTIGELRYLGGDDYKVALDYIRQTKCAQIKAYEKEFGPWEGPRPKDCS